MAQRKMEVRIIPMTAEHIEDVAEMERLVFSIPWSRKMIADELSNMHASYYVAVTDENLIIGYIGLHSVQDIDISRI